MSEIAASEWAQHRGAIREIDDRSGGTARVPSPPWEFSKSELPGPGLAPFQGEHNMEVFDQLGVNKIQVEKLLKKGALIDNTPTVN